MKIDSSTRPPRGPGTKPGEYMGMAGKPAAVFFVLVPLLVPFYSRQVHLVYWAKLAKHLQSGRFYAGIAALGPKEPHNGN